MKTLITLFLTCMILTSCTQTITMVQVNGERDSLDGQASRNDQAEVGNAIA